MDVTLLPHQVDHANFLCDVLTRNLFYIDTSVTGSGKSYVTAYIAQQFEFPVMIVCPPTVIGTWRSIITKYGLKELALISYGELTSKVGFQPKHGLLNRYDADGNVTFAVTPKFKEHAEKGFLLVLDEAQQLRNRGAAVHKAANAMIRHIFAVGGHNRVAVLSASPYNKEKQGVNFLYLLGFINQVKLGSYFEETKSFVLQGAQDLINACNKLDAATTQRVLQEMPPNKNNVTAFCHRLLLEVVKPAVGSAAPPPDIPTGKDAADGFYLFSNPQEKEKYDQAVEVLALAVAFNPETQVSANNGAAFGDLINALVQVENAKVPLFFRLIRSILKDDPRAKVIVFLNYNSSVDLLTARLDELAEAGERLNPLVMVGESTRPQRSAIIEAFQQPTDEYRLLITNVVVGGVGLNLDDQVGNYPRTALISPNYDAIALFQAAGRIFRASTKSLATIRFVYGQGKMQESRILNSLAKKGPLLRAITSGKDDKDDGPKFPGEYPAYVETAPLVE